MLQEIVKFFEDEILWRSTFDKEFQANFYSFQGEPKELSEKRHYYRSLGQGKYGLKPIEAAFKAFEEYADDFFDSSSNPASWKREEELQTLSYKLYHCASRLYWNYQKDNKAHRYLKVSDFNGPECFLKERWLVLYQQAKLRYEREEKQKKIETEEIESYKFNPQEIKDAWEGMVAGNVPQIAKDIWNVSHTRSTGFEIAHRLNISIKDFLFWMIVFRDHGMMNESIVMGQHLYHNQDNFFKNHPSLGSPLKEIVGVLSQNKNYQDQESNIELKSQITE